MKLTKRAIDAMQYEGDGKSRDVRWDDALPGFGIRVYPTNRKAFVISYRINGRKRLMTLDTFGVATLDQARKKAKLHLSNLDKQDPLEKRQIERQGETVKELSEAYLERHSKPRKRSWKDDERRINNRLIPIWGNLKASNIKHADVAALHRKIGNKYRYEANRMVELISKMYDLARNWGFVPADHINPARGIDYFEEEKRDRWVTPEELPKLTQAIDEEQNLYARYALWLYLLTGVRKSELLKAKWEQIDWERKELRLPETKAGRIHYVPLSDAAIKILSELPHLKENPYILPGLKKGAHMVNIDKPWRRVRNSATVKLWAENAETSQLITELTTKLKREPSLKEAKDAIDTEPPKGMEDVRLHDLRRTVGSWLAQSGNSLHLIGKILNHSNTSTTAVYARFAEDQVRNALESHSQQIMGAAKKQSTADVTELMTVKPSSY